MKITNIKPLYRYKNRDGSVVITPIQKNEGDTIHAYRPIADEGYELYYNGENQHCSVLDVFDISGWTQETIGETDKPIPQPEEELQ